MEKLTYRQFLKTDVDLSPLGVMRVDAPFEPYFCTPKGARVFGRSGVESTSALYAASERRCLPSAR